MVCEINLTPTASALEIPRPRRASPNGGEPTVTTNISARSWGTAHECVAAVVLVHGLGAHSGWFEAFGRRLKLRRIFSLAYDQVGFGKRAEEPFFSYKQWLDDLTSVVAFLRERVGDRPVYVAGNSMGAAVAMKAVSAGWTQPTGLAMFSPGFDGHPATFNLPYKARALWKAFTKPDDEVGLPYQLDVISREQSVLNWIGSDPDRRFAVPARMLLELLKMTIDATNQGRLVSTPVMMLTAGNDKIVDTAAAERVYSQIRSSKQCRKFEDAWHDLMFDPLIDQVVDETLRWISSTASIPGEKLLLVQS